MNRFVEALIDADFWVLRRVAMPISHWIDYRFHKNQYDQAVATLSAGLVMNVGANFSTFLRMPSVGVFAILSSAGLIFVYSDWLKKMSIASRKYERRPDQLSREGEFFMIWMSPFRLFILFIGGQIGAIPWIPPLSPIALLVTSPWLVLIGASLYLAGCIPPNRPRRKKRAWAWPEAVTATPA